MNLVLYHSVESTCSQKVRLVLAEKGVQWDEVRLNLRKSEQLEPEYLALNPKGVVPTLVHGDNVVRESSVINEYLEDSFPEPALRPEKAGDRARMRLLIKTFDDEVHPAIGALSYAIFLRAQMNELMSPEQLAEHFARVPDPGRRARQQQAHDMGLQSPGVGTAIQTLGQVVAQMDDALAAGPWLAGSQYSLADAGAVPYLMRAKALLLTPLWDKQERVSVWFERTQVRSEGLDITEPWGSASFHTMVSRHAETARPEIGQLLRDA